eukprot:CAMPEP_0205922286 /NCGR_PEP_ID=MMETSP1325-20131115/14218_1 /ASSEMBLY_ACC=CAM_ASM_000708 /TAXON_ID=236786 /ORGANISM="Florenciella sp., Strain RCC1007" /LENGTH=172 /DNA_ID=CAMNT_0053290273 /DNA_START=8 /DNA_END=526 /DNA_ORIENTATION=+
MWRRHAAEHDRLFARGRPGFYGGYGMGYIPFMFSLLMLYCVPVAIGYSYYTYFYCHNDCDDTFDDMGYEECTYTCFHEDTFSDICFGWFGVICVGATVAFIVHPGEPNHRYAYHSVRSDPPVVEGTYADAPIAPTAPGGTSDGSDAAPSAPMAPSGSDAPIAVATPVDATPV